MHYCLLAIGLLNREIQLIGKNIYKLPKKFNITVNIVFNVYYKKKKLKYGSSNIGACGTACGAIALV